MNNQKLLCPNCQSVILFDVESLIAGKSFVCSGCGAKIQLPNQSREVVAQTVDKLNEVKRSQQ